MPFITGNVIGTHANGLQEAEFNDGSGARVVHVAIDTDNGVTAVIVQRALTPDQLERWVLYLNEVTR